MTTPVVNNSVFRGFFKKQKLIRPNFIDWYRQLRIVLLVDDKLNYLEYSIPVAPVPVHAGQQVPPEALAAHAAWVKGIENFVFSPSRAGTSSNHERVSCVQAGRRTIRKLICSKDEELYRQFGASRSSHVTKPSSEPHLGLSEKGISFVQNYNMHDMEKTVNELHAMLNLHEQTLPKKYAPALHAIKAGKVQKKNHKNKKPQLVARGNNQGKGKSKLSYAPKPKIPPPPKRENLAKDSVCHQCGDTGHWKRNCPQYLFELLKNKKLSQGASTSGIFTLELFSFLGKSWVYDMGCGTHIYNTTQGLKGSRKLKPGALSLYMGNGVISVSHLYNDGFINRFENNAISVSRNNVVYFCTVPRDGVYENDLSNSNTNDSSMYAVSNKRAKLNLDSSLLWHCRLGHISKKHIEELQHDGLLTSTDIQSFEKCVSCMSGKMPRIPYSHQVERAKDLLGLIHTDVCGPFRTVSRQGASYFVTFTDDFSRYGYVYLLKHKHEVFETFKVFQKEVENQLRKTIKSLHSDRGGEYMSQEFLDHLKEHRIIAHRTPPYTP
ncbi:retrotransposon protein, putative, ty1-copia subclass [Tanacetum coccineum]|uniref:Retrotransposon protein, putative, ty1-copia subclass n=1 Tax=Tanacetum coccineum TaxID=301880 RepID=A0ABQ5ASG7_9ASTR